jgi:hypothetical protein
MTTPRLEAAQQRLARLMEQKKALETKISQEQGRLKERERKARTRRLIEYGGLVAIAKLDETDKATVLGMLLEGARRLEVDAAARQRWKASGDKALRQMEAVGRLLTDETTVEEDARQADEALLASSPTESEG